MTSSDGQIIRHPVSADNNCLFSSISFLFYSNSIDSKTLRNFVASKIESNRNVFTEAILGRSNSSYAKWIRRGRRNRSSPLDFFRYLFFSTFTDDSWAGGIELAIFAEEFQTEICVINTKCRCRIDHFGEDRQYSSQVFLLYDDSHYEPRKSLKIDFRFTFSFCLCKVYFVRSGSNETRQTRFRRNDEEILRLIDELRSDF